MSLNQFIESYGYWAVLLGTMIEGEIFLLTAGLFVCHGYLELPLVAAAALCGTVAVDQSFFLMGRTVGQRFLLSNPALTGRVNAVRKKMEHYENLSIFGFQFLYGLRGICAFAIGTWGINPLRFTVLNTAGAVIWVALVIACGYWSGSVFNTFFPGLSKNLLWLVPGVIIPVIALLGTIGLRKRTH